MALYTAIGSQFKASLMKEFDSLLDERIKSVITQTLKQVAHDYDLDYKALKNRYCSKESLVEYVTTVDLNEARHEARQEAETQIVDHDEYAFEPEPVVKPKAKANVTASKPAMALSKMKKAELVEECEVRGLDSEGTVSQLRERLKDSRDPEPAKTKKKASPKKKVAEGDPDPVKKKASPKKKKVEGDPEPVKKKPVKKKKEEPAPVPHAVVALEEEDEDEDAVHVKPALEDEDEDEDVCHRVPVDGDDEEFEVEDDDSGFEKKLRAILLEAGELEEEEEELD
jgi:hypothetical protein